MMSTAVEHRAPPATSSQKSSQQSLRLYVFDCGTLHIADLGRFSLKPTEVATSDLAVACFLVVHPNGTLMWDVGAVPDADWTPTGSRLVHRLELPEGQSRDIDLIKPLAVQLKEAGYSAGQITYLALSHYHYDHTANANDFASSTWLVRKEERDAMFADKAPGTTQPSSYAALRNAKTVLIQTADYDVFGDETVVIKSAPGHTPGHQVLALKLVHSGRILLSGDLYHYPEERKLDRVPTFEFNADQTRASREAVEEFLRRTGAQLWIQHDFLSNAELKKSPAYYD
jgi:glyoxylase-like metal-dependent hydrolase (beta-lactamase superfamily II)